MLLLCEDMSMLNLNTVLERAAIHIREAGARIAHVSKTAVHEKDGHFNFVTETDVAIQEYLRRELEQLIPDSRFFAEEQENEALTDAPTWVVDPIDGTTNFILSRHASCVSVALLQNKTPMLGMIYQPYLDELFSAVRGQGAFLNGKPIRVSDRPFDKALTDIGTAPYYAELARATAYCFEQFLIQGGDIRRVGSAALDCCDIACGRADIFCEMCLSPWDFAAGALLIEEAGGVFMMPYEDATDFSKSTCILACTPQCKEKALEIVRKAKSLIFCE